MYPNTSTEVLEQIGLLVMQGSTRLTQWTSKTQQQRQLDWNWNPEKSKAQTRACFASWLLPLGGTRAAWNISQPTAVATQGKSHTCVQSHWLRAHRGEAINFQSPVPLFPRWLIQVRITSVPFAGNQRTPGQKSCNFQDWFHSPQSQHWCTPMQANISTHTRTHTQEMLNCRAHRLLQPGEHRSDSSSESPWPQTLISILNSSSWQPNLLQHWGFCSCDSPHPSHVKAQPRCRPHRPAQMCWALLSNRAMQTFLENVLKESCQFWISN